MLPYLHSERSVEKKNCILYSLLVTESTIFSITKSTFDVNASIFAQ